MDPETLLKKAIALAGKALEAGNYPFGAVLTDTRGKVLAEGYNENFSAQDITAHAEIQCLRRVGIGELLDNARDYALFTSGEPCGGCSFFIARCRAVRTVTWALTDPQQAGFDDLMKMRQLVRQFSGIMAVAEPYPALREQSAALLRAYYLRLGNTAKAELY